MSKKNLTGRRRSNPATGRRNVILFGLPVGGTMDSEVVKSWMTIFEGRNIIMETGQTIAANHNFMIERALTIKGWEYFTWVEHDHFFSPDAVFGEIEGLDPRKHPIVNFLYTTRELPVQPVGFQREEDGTYRLFTPGEMKRWTLDEPGLHPVYAVPMGLTAIHRSVFERMIKADPEQPLFWDVIGKRGHGYMTDDVFFCTRAQELGIPVHIETRHEVEHIGRVRFGMKMYWAQTERLVKELEAMAAEEKPALRVVDEVEEVGEAVNA